MKLLTAAIIKQLEKNPLYSTETKNVAPVLVKFFNPCGSGTWLAIEGSLVCPCHGYIHTKELGYFSLSELQSVRLRFGLRIERDMHFSGMELDKTTNEVRSAS